MKRCIVLIAALGLCFLMVAPAMADYKLGGYFRTQVTAGTHNGAPAKDKHSLNAVDNRFRFKFTNSLNENVKIVYYGEVDSVWGDTSKGAIGGGGKLGADGVNIETKQVYLDFKVPETPLAVRAGIQGFAGRFDNAFSAHDMAGAKVLAKLDTVTLGAGYFVWNEEDKYKDDDRNLYALLSDFKISKAFKMRADLYSMMDKRAGDSKTNVNTLGLRADFKGDAFGVYGWALYQFGETEVDNGSDTDLGGLAATVKANFNIGSVKAGARLLYYMADDDADEDMAFKGGSGSFEFPKDNLMIFLTDLYYNNLGGGRHALTDAAYKGYGLIGVNLSANMNITETVYTKFGAGFFMAADDQINDDESTKKEGSILGQEITAMIGVKVAEKVDVSARGAYALVGDFYEVEGGDDPDDMYKGVLMLNVKY